VTGRFPSNSRRKEMMNIRWLSKSVGREDKKGFFHRVVLLATAGCSCDTEEILERMLRRAGGCL